MADKNMRVKLRRTVQGEGTENDAREILVKGSVLDLPAGFASELIGSKAAESAPDDKPYRAPLHPPLVEKAGK